MPNADVVQALRRSLAAQQGPVELIETHISWVLLAGELAVKLKKPVAFGFLDFSTPERRRHFCREELRLNRRLAPQLYLDVVDVVQGPGGITLGGPGTVIDAALRMHRMAGDALAGTRLAQGRLDADALRRFALRLARFHRQASVPPPGAPFGSAERVRDDALHAIDSLAPLADGATCATLRCWLEDQAAALAPAIESRRAAGRVREGHGDLHLDNVVELDGELTAFDCIEFDEGLRFIDVMADLGFLLMDLRAHGRADLAHRTLDAYLEHSGDFDGLRVLRFYEVYRAVVRALVAALRSRGGTHPAGPPDADYLGLAQRLAAAPRAALAITHGLPGSGKSRLALDLVACTGAVRMRSDVERKRLAGLAPLADSRAAGDLYTPGATEATYARLLALADDALAAGWPVIIDAAFLRREQRDAARALAVRRGVPFAVFDCHAALPELRRRLRERSTARTDPSEADESVLEQLIGHDQALAADETPSALLVSTEQPVDAAALAAAWLAR